VKLSIVHAHWRQGRLAKNRVRIRTNADRLAGQGIGIIWEPDVMSELRIVPAHIRGEGVNSRRIEFEFAEDSSHRGPRKRKQPRSVLKSLLADEKDAVFTQYLFCTARRSSSVNLDLAEVYAKRCDES